MIAAVFFATCLYPCECAASYYRFPPATHRYEAEFYRVHPYLRVPECEAAEWKSNLPPPR